MSEKSGMLFRSSGRGRFSKRAGQREALANEVGPVLVTRLFSLIQEVRRGDLDDFASQAEPEDAPTTRGLRIGRAAGELATWLNQNLEKRDANEISLSWSRGGLTLETYDIPLREASLEQGIWLAQALSGLRVTQLTVIRGLDQEGLLSFLFSIDKALDGSGALEAASGGEHIKLLLAQNDRIDTLLSVLSMARRYSLVELYIEALSVLRAQAESESVAAAGRGPLLSLATRLIDAHRFDSNGLVGLTAVQPFPASAFNRTLDTCIIATGMSMALGIDDLDTADLAMALMSRPAKMFSLWWDFQGVSAGEAARRAGKMFGEDPLGAVVVFEESAPLSDRLPSGYYGKARKFHMATRIIRVAEAYVELLQPGSAQDSLVPEMALQVIMANAGLRFDPMACRGLVALLGLIPPGSTVQLASREVAVVVRRSAPDVDPRKPVVRPISLRLPGVFDLASPKLADYQIVQSIPASDSGLNPFYFFVL
jgi:hypothetical protein